MRIGSVPDLDAARRYLGELALQLDAHERWQIVSSDLYTAAPASSSSFRVSRGAQEQWADGLPIRYRVGGVDYYGLIRNQPPITSNIVNVYGPAISSGIEAMWIGRPEMVQQHAIHLVGEYGSYSGDIMSAMGQSYLWAGPTAYLVSATIRHTVGRTGGTREPTLGVYLWTGAAWAYVFVSDIVASTAWTVQGQPRSLYRIKRGDQLTLYCTQVDDGAPHAKNLNAILDFVLE